MQHKVLQSQQMNSGMVKTWPSEYRYLGKDKESGLYRFSEHPNAGVELFAKRTAAPAGWCLKLNGYYFEFCRSQSGSY